MEKEFTIISKEPKISTKEDSVKLLVQECDSTERLFIMTIGLGDIEHLLAEHYNDEVTLHEALQDLDTLIEFIQNRLDNVDLSHTMYELTPYHEPKYVTFHKSISSAKNIIEEEPWGFIDTTEYHSIIY